jgi:hypothetical protein
MHDMTYVSFHEDAGLVGRVKEKKKGKRRKHARLQVFARMYR